MPPAGSQLPHPFTLPVPGAFAHQRPAHPADRPTHPTLLLHPDPTPHPTPAPVPGTTAAHLPSCPRPAPDAGSRPRTCTAGRAPPSTPPPVPRARVTQFLVLCRRFGARSGRQASQETPKDLCPQSLVSQSGQFCIHCQLLFLPATRPEGASFPWWGGEGKGGVVHTQGACNLGGSEGRLFTERPPSSSGTLRRKERRGQGYHSGSRDQARRGVPSR